MVISQITGGLGNQLSEYACGYSIAKYLGQELVLDISDYVCKGYFRPYCLDKLQIGSHRKLVYPPVSVEFMKAECIPKELREHGLRIVDLSEYKTRRELLEAVKGTGDIYLMGYGGIHYCTPEDQEEIREKFQMKLPSVAVELFKKRIQEEYSVAVHLRRTDFIDVKAQSSVEYFRAAITYMKIFHPEAQFYFFSDDIQYAMEQFGTYENYHYVHLLGGMDADLEEFFCLSACNGRILSTKSTFSRWASELNQKEEKLDICQGEETGNNLVCLNKSAVDKLNSQYKTEGALYVRKDALNIVDTAYQLVSQGLNRQAIETIDQAGFDSYGIPEEEIRKLTALKEIALAQTGDKGLPAALRTFYEQMQRENKDAAFHADYFRALYQSGQITESAIHAALANRLGDPENYQKYFEIIPAVPFGQELYQLVRDCPARHFIFISVNGWNYYITYVKTLAALLARMGQKVTMLQPMDLTIEGNVNEGVIVKKLLENISCAASVYRYHVDLLLNPQIHDNDKTYYMFRELIRQCAARFDMETVVVTTVPDVFLESKIESIKYVVPDICDPLNIERMYFINDLERYIYYMASQSDVIFLSDPVWETVSKCHGSKVHRAFPAWDSSQYQFLNMEIDFTENYIHSDQMIRNAAELLRI